MRRFRTYLSILSMVLLSLTITAQSNEVKVEAIFTFQEFIGYVKTHHPLIKQAQLRLTEGEATLLKARGGFDPKIEVDYDRKKFKDTEYYDQLNSTFKIPTWYGVEFKANFEENTGEFLDPSLDVPDGGLYSAGVSLSLARGLLVNERAASLRMAKAFREQTRAERDLMVNKVLFDASTTYLIWLEAHNDALIYQNFLENARTRLNAVTRSVEAGDVPEIDATEASIAVLTRERLLADALLKRQKASLALSNYLWIDGIPLELTDAMIPSQPDIAYFEEVLNVESSVAMDFSAENHPKLSAIDAKIKGLEIDRSLKRNNLLPKVELQYNFLSTEYDQISSFNTANYKAFLDVSFPLFLRKERGELRLSNAKLQNAEFERLTTILQIENEVEAAQTEIGSLQTQNDLMNEIVTRYQTMLQAEERKFELGESSLFLVNSREQKLIDARLKENELTIKQFTATAALYHKLGVLSVDDVN